MSHSAIDHRGQQAEDQLPQEVVQQKRHHNEHSWGADEMRVTYREDCTNEACGGGAGEVDEETVEFRPKALTNASALTPPGPAEVMVEAGHADTDVVETTDPHGDESPS
jgi:hypothetical protein